MTRIIYINLLNVHTNEIFIFAPLKVKYKGLKMSFHIYTKLLVHVLHNAQRLQEQFTQSLFQSLAMPYWHQSVQGNFDP